MKHFFRFVHPTQFPFPFTANGNIPAIPEDVNDEENVGSSIQDILRDIFEDKDEVIV